jgi:hypothetical protein
MGNFKRFVPKYESDANPSIFAPPPLLVGEDAAAFDTLLKRVLSDVKPSDIFEEMWTHDIAYLAWDKLRRRQILRSLIAEAMPKNLTAALKPLVPVAYRYDEQGRCFEQHPRPVDTLVNNWAKRDPAAVSKVEQLMASAKLTMDSVIGAAFVDCLDNIERIDHTITVIEGRIYAALREIAHHRATFAQTLRAKIHEIEDAEFQTIEHKALAPNDAT